MNKLDKIDRQILGLIQEDASLPIQQIADKVGLSVNPCWRRIRQMEQAGVIQARVALVDPEKVGLGLTVYVRVKTNQHSGEWAKRLNEVIRKAMAAMSQGTQVALRGFSVIRMMTGGSEFRGFPVAEK